MLQLSLTAPLKARDTPEICAELQHAILHITAVVDAVPVALGQTLQEEIRTTTCTLLFDVASFANKFLKTPRKLDTLSNLGYMSSTGLVWKACDVVRKMSMNNGEAVAKTVKSKISLVDDAISEAEETLASEGDHDGWDDEDDKEEKRAMTDSEKDIVKKSLVIVKAAKLMLKKVMTTAHRRAKAEAVERVKPILDLEQIHMMDQLAVLADMCSTRVDDLVCHLDPPIPLLEVSNAASVLAQTCTELLDLAKALFDEPATISWFETCRGQIQNVLEQILEKNSAR